MIGYGTGPARYTISGDTWRRNSDKGDSVEREPHPKWVALMTGRRAVQILRDHKASPNGRSSRSIAPVPVFETRL